VSAFIAILLFALARVERNAGEIPPGNAEIINLEVAALFAKME
jgi:hypothetical protein